MDLADRCRFLLGHRTSSQFLYRVRRLSAIRNRPSTARTEVQQPCIHRRLKRFLQALRACQNLRGFRHTQLHLHRRLRRPRNQEFGPRRSG